MQESRKLRKNPSLAKLNLLEARLDALESRIEVQPIHRTPGQLLQGAYNQDFKYDWNEFLRILNKE